MAPAPPRSETADRRQDRGEDAGMPARRWRRWAPLAVILALLAILPFTGVADVLSFDSLRRHEAALTGWVADNRVPAGLAFILLYALATALSVPGAAVLTVTGGFLFGIVLGSVLVLVGATAGAVGIFLIARTAAGAGLKRRCGRWLERLEAGFRQDAFSYLLTLRLIPVVPFWLVNLVPAFLGVGLATYTVTTVIGIAPATIVYVAIGNGLGAAFAAGEAPDLGLIFDPAILLPLLGLALLALLPAVYKKVRGRPVPPAPSQEESAPEGSAPEDSAGQPDRASREGEALR